MREILSTLASGVIVGTVYWWIEKKLCRQAFQDGFDKGYVTALKELSKDIEKYKKQIQDENHD